MDSIPEKVQFEIRSDALWVPVYTRPLHESRLLDYFAANSIPAYLPVVPDFKVHNVAKNGKPYTYRKSVFRPMLSSYIFAQLTREQRKSAWLTKSIYRILDVKQEEQPQFIEELRGLQMMEALANADSKLEFKREFHVNDRFMIEAPSEFEGTYGYLVEKKKKFLWVIRIELLGQYVNVEIDPALYKMKKVG